MSTPATRLTGQLVLGDRVVPGHLDFTSTIAAITLLPDAPATLILPGFIDAHVHGGDGADTMDGPEGVRQLARFHARHGTTTLLPTTITNPWEDVVRALNAVREVMQQGVPGGPDIPGAHLEGPFISPGRLGAQPPFTVLPEPELVRQVLETSVVRAVTIAPELPGALDAALAMGAAGVRIGIGHTRADTATVTAFLGTLHAAGVRTCATHLYNAMGGIEGREPGVPGALLADSHAWFEVILDLLHVHPTSFLLARAAAPERVTLVTDAMRAAGLGDGDSELGGQRVIVRGGEARLPGGSLAGSVLTMDQALRNAARSGIPLPEASRMLSAVPAASLDLADRGTLSTGQRADVVVLDTDLNVQAVYVGGVPIPGAGA
ncbi:N-acetylglucosamine-6-phosphate deacetylase [Deinococcus metalli]|uniref:N-acetylglucosamine-6-phosphate deacetylase n=1 Tax=Deinococcus metalli TaxID=1141878 RepID=A0A7W8NPY1_9DEIO|nr:N-acetylglucosamine-6-phosphate deacetylase [Deinococcus metalli]MBB5377301.1 N-acetylglucosamine-6-phosphate deacetylase [Deinococcus metalli]GHF47523.1 N-acetylglucosamine-6-phosphate deacetylase [Deinococcus metalli]